MYYKKSDLLYIFGSLIILFLFVCVAMERKQLLCCFILLPFVHLPAPKKNKTRYTNADLKISLYVCVDIKTIPLKFHILNSKYSRVISREFDKFLKR